MRDLECRTPVAPHVGCEAGSARGKTPRTIGFHILRDGKLNATNAPKDGAASALRFWTGSGFVMPVLAPSRWRELASELGRQRRDFKDALLPYAHWPLNSSGTGERLTTRRISGSSGAKEDPSKVLVSP